MRSSSDGDADISNRSIDAPDDHVDDTQAIDKLPEVVHDDNNDNYRAVPLLPVISSQFNSTDPHAVLSVPPNATMQHIVSSYHNLAKKHHPDCLTLHRIFAAIFNDYEILGGTEHRTQHDEALQLIDEATDSDEDSNGDDVEDSNGDGDSPPEEDITSYVCNWTFVLNGCKCPQLQPLTCTYVGCNRLVH